jgi:hypothetical protein
MSEAESKSAPASGEPAPEGLGSGTQKYGNIRCSVGGFDVGARVPRRPE